MLNTIIPGSQNVSVDLYIQDFAGAPRTGLAFNTAGLRAYFRRSGNGSPTVITLATLASATAAWSSGGFIEIDAANMPGWYRLDVPNAAVDVGAIGVGIALSGASSMTPCNTRLALRGLNNEMRVNRAQAGSASTATLDAAASATDDTFNRNILAIIAGTGAGQSRYVLDYVGSSKIATVTPNWVTNPDSTSIFSVTPYGIDSVALDTVVDAVWDESRAGHVLSDSFGAVLQAMNDGTAQAGTASSLTLASGASATDDFYNGWMVQIISGTGLGQTRFVTDYVGSTRVATMDKAWAVTPNSTSRYVVLSAGALTELTAASIDAILDEVIPDASGVPVTFTLRNAIGWLASLAVFKQTQSATTGTMRNRADNANVGTRTISDDGSTGTFGRWS